MNFDNYMELNYYNQIFFLLQSNIIGKLIKKGKKLYALKLYNELKYGLKKTKKNPLLIILIAVLNSLIKVHFSKVRLGGVKKDVPVALKFDRQIRFTISALLLYVKTTKSINVKKLVNLICFSYKSKGPLIQNNNKLYQKAIANRVLLNFIKK